LIADPIGRGFAHSSSRIRFDTFVPKEKLSKPTVEKLEQDWGPLRKWFQENLGGKR
jgi:hypothetical protein